MRRLAAAAAAGLLFFLFTGFDFFGLFGAAPQGETAEHVFNMANEAMIKGNDTDAINLYYELIQKHPEFREYRADALYRLGGLLYKTDRFEEAEKIFGMLAGKYQNYPQIRAVYEKLLYIYMRELKDEGKANKIRQVYEKKFGKGQVLEEAAKTEQLLSAQGSGGSEILKMAPPDIGLTGVAQSDSYDTEFFPVKCSISMDAYSPDRKFNLERKKQGDRYALYVSGGGKKAALVAGTKNGFAPQWSWDDKYAVFTAMNWGAKERQIKIYDAQKNRVVILFAGSAVQPLTCISPNGGLVAFWYQDGLWLADRSGRSVSFITKKIDAKDVFMMAWSRDGDRILIGKKANARGLYYTCTLGRKDFIIAK